MNPRSLAGRMLPTCSLVMIPVAVFAQASTLSKAVRTRESMEPALSRPEQDKATAQKLADLRAKTGGKRPNIVWFVVDDTGWGDSGVYGVGAVVGAERNHGLTK